MTRFTGIHRPGALSAVVFLLAAVGCSTAQPDTGSFVPARGIVYGEIRDGLGQLQTGAVVEVRAFHEVCTRPDPLFREGQVSATGGRYRVVLTDASFAEFTACLVIDASVGSGAFALRGTVGDRALMLRAASVGLPDSLRVDVVVK